MMPVAAAWVPATIMKSITLTTIYRATAGRFWDVNYTTPKWNSNCCYCDAQQN